MLIGFNVCDYVNANFKDWFWTRIENSLLAPTKSSDYEGPSGRLGAKAKPQQTHVTGTTLVIITSQ